MPKLNENKIEQKNLIQEIKTLLNQAKKQVALTINTTMVKTYFEIGKIIVEEEQNGENRAEYGKETLKNLSMELTKEYGKGFTKRNLELMRQFYLVYSKTKTLYSQSEKSETLSRKSTKPSTPLTKSQKQQTLSVKSTSQEITTTKPPNFNLSWSHYLILMRMEEVERTFYEKEIEINNWSVRQLQRQIDSGLFERVALSLDKNKVLEDNLQKYHQPANTNFIYQIRKS